MDDDLWQAKEVPAAAAGHLAGVAAGEGRAGHPHRGCGQAEVQDHPPNRQQPRYNNYIHGDY